ncbi:MAG: hypothetical protein P1U34_01505 [Coxiellaceae bacterium]|nr:hypothetical protein [Coxiellaceae bacterium]
MKLKLHYFFTFLACSIGFAGISVVIFMNHINPGFWFQSDNTWAPHFIYDIVVLHHSPVSWWLANGTINLLDTVPFIIFSFFSHDIVKWLGYNAIFNLSFYFLIFYTLSRCLFDNAKAVLLMMASCLISMVIIANFKNIHFTLESVLISGQHFTQLLISWLCLIVCIQLLKNENSRKLQLLLASLVIFGVVSDVLLIMSFVVPAMLSLFIVLRLADKAHASKFKIIGIIAISVILGVIIWKYNPLVYMRMAATVSFDIFHLLDALWLFLASLIKHHPLYMSANILFFMVSTLVVVHAIKNGVVRDQLLPPQRRLLFTILFCNFVWIVGLASMLVNYHLNVYINLGPIVDRLGLRNPPYDGLIRDGVAFFVTPVFIGIPVLIVYLLGFVNTAKKNLLLTVFNVIAFSAVGVGVYGAIMLIKSSQPTPLQSQRQIMRCLADNIKSHRLDLAVADYFVYRPIVVMSNAAISIVPMQPNNQNYYRPYLSRFESINNRRIDYWIDSYKTFFSDSGHANYRTEAVTAQIGLKEFGPPTGEFYCKGVGGQYLHAYIYKNNAIMKRIVSTFHALGAMNIHINKKNQLSFHDLNYLAG